MLLVGEDQKRKICIDRWKGGGDLYAESERTVGAGFGGVLVAGEAKALSRAVSSTTILPPPPTTPSDTRYW